MVNQFGGAFAGGGGGGGGTGASFTTLSITLTGIGLQTVSTQTMGSYHLTISSPNFGAPTLACDVTKRAPGDPMTILNIISWPAADTCTLGITWLAGGPIQLSKSLGTYDGIYTVALVSTP